MRRIVTAALVAGLSAFGTAALAGPAVDPGDSGPPIHFAAKLSSDEEVPPVDGNGSGMADFTLERKGLKLSWKIDLKGLSGAPTQVYLHGPERPGANAPMVINLAPNGAKGPQIVGDTVLDELQLSYFLTQRVYVNVHTAKFKDGEVRGQIERIAPGKKP